MLIRNSFTKTISNSKDVFQTDQYKPIIAIYNILTDKINTVEMSKDLLIYTNNVDLHLLKIELSHYYRNSIFLKNRKYLMIVLCFC
jgi:hypothetical protein